MQEELKKGVEVNVDHMAKQRKRKDLSNDYVYASHNGVVEMFPLGMVSLNGVPLEEVIKGLKEENKKLQTRLDTNKEVTKSLLERIKNIEGKMDRYGIK